MSNNHSRSFPANTVGHEIGGKKFQRKLPHSSSEHYYCCVCPAGWQSVTVMCSLWAGGQTLIWFTNFLPTTRTTKKIIQIELLWNFWVDMLFDRELAQKWLRPSVECRGALVNCFLIAGNYGRIHINLGLRQVGGQVTSSLEDSWHTAPLVLIVQVNGREEIVLAAFRSTTIFPVQLCEIHGTDWWGGKNKTNTSSASRLMKLAIAKPSMTSSSQDTDSLFLRRGGLCLPNPGRHSLPPGPRTLLVPHASRSEPEDRDVARSPARSTLLLRRSLSRWERDLRLCLNPVVRLGPSMLKRDSVVHAPVAPKALQSRGSGTKTANQTPPHRPLAGSPVKMALMEAVAIIHRP